MATLNELTPDQFKTLLDEYFAEPIRRQKMTESEIRDLAHRLNEKINVPLINETREEKILIKIVVRVDTFLYDNMPNEFYDLLRSLDQGIDDAEAKRLIKRLSKLANKQIDIPYVPEVVEYFAIRFILSIIINAARKQWNLTIAKENAENLNIPDAKDVDDAQLEALIA